MCAGADADTDTAYGYGKSNRYMYSDSKRIRTQDTRQVPWSDDYEWGLASCVAWQSFEVVPNVIGPTSTTCE